VRAAPRRVRRRYRARVSGTPLPPRTFTADGAFVVAAFLACAGVYGLANADAAAQPWAYAAVSLAVVVVLAMPLAWAGWWLRRQRVEVHPDRVVVRSGERVRREVVLADLVEVHVGEQVRLHDLRGSRAMPRVLLRSTTGAVAVSRHDLETLDPLLLVLVPHVRARPGLLAGGAQREAFERLLPDAAR